MLLLLLGLVLFLGVHSLSIVAPVWRDRIVVHWGKLRWQLIYSLLSLAGLLLILKGFALARAMPVVLYVPPHWLSDVARLLMLPVFPLLFAAYLPGRIQRTLKHPMLVAVKCWALAHLLANGMAADLVLFGSFLAWAVIDRISLRRRPLRPAPGLPASAANDVIAVVLGLAVYALVVMWAHQSLFGVSPLS